MSDVLAELADGRHGLVAVPAAQLVIGRDPAMGYLDRAQSVVWWFSFTPDLQVDLSPAHLDELERDARRHTRYMFDRMSEDTRARRPEEWSALIELARIDVDGGVGLYALHRMNYEPGRELIMGHTLVPTARGLFEARWVTRDQMTGLRESALVLKSTNPLRPLAQAEIDDPALDATFPEHALSRARAQKRWFERGTLRVTEPPPAAPAGELVLEELRCALTLAPRFLPADTVEPNRVAVFNRVSFCATDGVDRLVVANTREPIRMLAVRSRLASFAGRDAQKLYHEAGARGLTCDVVRLDDVRPAVQVVVEGEGGPGDGKRRLVGRYFVADDGVVWSILISSTIAIPVAELAATTAQIAASWRPLR